MWLAFSAAIFLIIVVSSYAYWLIFINPVRSIIRKCYVFHDVRRHAGLLSASTVSLNTLAVFIDEARSRGLEFVTPGVFLRHENDRSILLTFDDGLVSFYESVFPILRSERIPAVVFMPHGLIGDRAEWDYAGTNRRHLTSAQIEELRSSDLIYVGSHSRTHADLTRVQEERLINEVETHGAMNCKLLSYPFGRFDAATLSAVDHSGYDASFGTLNGSVKLWSSRHVIPRIPITRFDNRFTIGLKLQLTSFAWIEIIKSRVIGMFAPLTFDLRGER
jgi:peptidoglycan/xylan/chitin deacetylase (PgdA/CDA1 family)